MTDLSKPFIHVGIAHQIAHVTLDRPPVNAFTLEMYRDLAGIFHALDERGDVNCVVLGATGDRAFSAGFDFKLFAASQAEDDPDRPRILRGMLESVRNCRLPVIAAVNGAALGAGCVIAAASDICVAADHARFSLPEIDFGRVGGSAYVGSRTSKGFVRYMALTGKLVSAQESHKAGLVDFLVPRAELQGFVDGLAREIAAKPAMVLRQTKRALNEIEYLPIDEGYEIEQMLSARARAGQPEAES